MTRPLGRWDFLRVSAAVANAVAKGAPVPEQTNPAGGPRHTTDKSDAGEPAPLPADAELAGAGAR